MKEEKGLGGTNAKPQRLEHGAAMSPVCPGRVRRRCKMSAEADKSGKRRRLSRKTEVAVEAATVSSSEAVVSSAEAATAPRGNGAQIGGHVRRG